MGHKPLHPKDDSKAFYMNVFLTITIGILSMPYMLQGLATLVASLLLVPIDLKVFKGKWNINFLEAIDAIGLKDEIELQNSDGRYSNYTVEEEEMLLHLYLHAQQFRVWNELSQKSVSFIYSGVSNPNFAILFDLFDAVSMINIPGEDGSQPDVEFVPLDR